MFFLVVLLIQCKIRRGRPSDTRPSTCRPLLVYFSHSWSISVFKLHFFG